MLHIHLGGLDGQNCAIVIAESLARTIAAIRITSGKKQHKDKLVSPNFLQTFLTHTPGCPGVKKFLPITMATGKHTFWRGRRRFVVWTSITLSVLEKLCPEEVRVDSPVPITGVRWWSGLPQKHRNWASETLRSLCCELDRAISVRSCNIRSMWKRNGPRDLTVFTEHLATGDLAHLIRDKLEGNN